MNKVQAEKLKNTPTWRKILNAVVFCTVLLVASGSFFNIAANYNGINIFIPEENTGRGALSIYLTTTRKPLGLPKGVSDDAAATVCPTT